MKFLNWHPKRDETSKAKEFELHRKLHRKMSNRERNPRELLEGKRTLRWKGLEKALQKIGTDLCGNVLEVGAGDGWCSANISRNKSIDQMYTMECNKPAVEELIPDTFDLLGAPTENLHLVLGSFNCIEKKDFFHFVIAMGALHHSENLYHTMREIYNSLRPGGHLIAQEPYMDDSVPNEYFYEREEETKEFRGVETVKNKERTDLFYRLCEYRTAAYHAGFNVDYFWIRGKNSILRWVKTKVKEYVLGKVLPKNIMLILQKPEKHPSRQPPTAWEE